MKTPRPISFGEPLPLLHMKSNRNPSFALGSMGGRFVLMCVVLDHANKEARAGMEALNQTQLDEGARVAILVAPEAAFGDALVAKIAETKPVMFDDERNLMTSAGFADRARDGAGRWLLFDPSLRVVGLWPLQDASTAIAALSGMPEPSAHAGVALHAPVLLAPRIFEPEFCKQLIAYYDANGGEPSGTTRENEAGKTYVALDPGFKRRSDCVISDAKLRDAAMQRIFWRLLPEVEKAFMWRSTRMERYLVARYDSDGGGFFRAHRDNTTKGTAHRRFAVTINLNADEYDGGDLRFPEYGARTYRAPTGGAVVFGCALLHEATPVTRGRRYAFLPFLYDEAAAKVRAENNPHLDDSIPPYQA